MPVRFVLIFSCQTSNANLTSDNLGVAALPTPQDSYGGVASPAKTNYATPSNVAATKTDSYTTPSKVADAKTNSYTTPSNDGAAKTGSYAAPSNDRDGHIVSPTSTEQKPETQSSSPSPGDYGREGSATKPESYNKHDGGNRGDRDGHIVSDTQHKEKPDSYMSPSDGGRSGDRDGHVVSATEHKQSYNQSPTDRSSESQGREHFAGHEHSGGPIGRSSFLLNLHRTM